MTLRRPNRWLDAQAKRRAARWRQEVAAAMAEAAAERAAVAPEIRVEARRRARLVHDARTVALPP